MMGYGQKTDKFHTASHSKQRRIHFDCLPLNGAFSVLLFPPSPMCEEALKQAVEL